MCGEQRWRGTDAVEMEERGVKLKDEIGKSVGRSLGHSIERLWQVTPCHVGRAWTGSTDLTSVCVCVCIWSVVGWTAAAEKKRDENKQWLGQALKYLDVSGNPNVQPDI